MTTIQENHIFVIDTNSYSGSFERELCAYITGQYGDCEVGDTEALIFKEETSSDISLEFSSIIEHRADDRGCYRPCQISVHPNSGAYNSVEIYFTHAVPKHLIDLMIERAYKFPAYYSPSIQIEQFRLLKEVIQKHVVEVLL